MNPRTLAAYAMRAGDFVPHDTLTDTRRKVRRTLHQAARLRALGFTHPGDDPEELPAAVLPLPLHSYGPHISCVTSHRLGTLELDGTRYGYGVPSQPRPTA